MEFKTETIISISYNDVDGEDLLSLYNRCYCADFAPIQSADPNYDHEYFFDLNVFRNDKENAIQKMQQRDCTDKFIEVMNKAADTAARWLRICHEV